MQAIAAYTARPRDRSARMLLLFSTAVINRAHLDVFLSWLVWKWSTAPKSPHAALVFDGSDQHSQLRRVFVVANLAVINSSHLDLFLAGLILLSRRSGFLQRLKAWQVQKNEGGLGGTTLY